MAPFDKSIGFGTPGAEQDLPGPETKHLANRSDTMDFTQKIRNSPQPKVDKRFSTMKFTNCVKYKYHRLR